MGNGKCNDNIRKGLQDTRNKVTRQYLGLVDLGNPYCLIDKIYLIINVIPYTDDLYKRQWRYKSIERIVYELASSFCSIVSFWYG